MNTIKKETVESEKVAVWDTYVKKKDGQIMHFDIIVPETFKDQEQIFKYAENYAKKAGESNITIDTTRCQFCHVEEVTDEVSQAILQNGHYVLKMEDIPANLPNAPSKRDLVLYLKGHFKEFRFTNFAGVPLDTIEKIIRNKGNE